MGKGDKKTKKGKITNGSYGVTRKRKETEKIIVKPKPKKETPVAKVSTDEKKAPVKKAPVVKKETTTKAAAKK